MGQKRKPLAAEGFARLRRRARQHAVLKDEIVLRLTPSRLEYTFWDANVVGFGVRVRPTGQKSYIVSFRDPRTGKQRRHTIADCSRLGTEEARTKAHSFLAALPHSGLPVKAVRASRITLNQAVANYELKAVRDLSPAWGRRACRLIRKHVAAKLGNVPLEDISRSELRLIFNAVAARHPTTAVRIRGAFSAFLTWCVDQEILQMNPLIGTRLPAKLKSRDRVLNHQEIVAVWKASASLEGPWCVVVRLLLLTGQRKSEILEMHSMEIDRIAKLLNLPPTRTKNRRSHSVPLVPQAWSLLEPYLRPDRPLFTVFDRSTPMKFRQEIMDGLRDVAKVRDFRLHDLRRTAASEMARLGTRPEVIEAVLNHKGIISGVAAVYNRYDYLNERREALEKWADELDRLVSEAPVAHPEEEVDL